MQSILIVDDEPAICSSLQFALEDEYTVYTRQVASEALTLIEEKPIDCVLLDLKIGQDNGILLIPEIKQIQPYCEIIVMTAYGSIETSVQAMKAGAYHYLTKPLNLEEVRILIYKAIEFQYLYHQVQVLTQAVRKENYGGLIGKSLPMRNLFQLIDRVKDINSNILISGESGTGKELVARAIHYEGKRKNKPFHAINCAAIPENLLESELFGYEKGAFSGAFQRREGLFASSHEGTIFLDEIGEMPMRLQSKILRVIQEREIIPLGTNQRQIVDVRIIAATNRQLQEDVREGRFREDLYYRLNVIPIFTPPLRERQDDVRLLIEYFIVHHAIRMGKKRLNLSPRAKRLLYEYTYPGNVRELSNIIEYAVAMSGGDTIDVEDLSQNIRSRETSFYKKTPETIDVFDPDSLIIPTGITLEEVEKKVILHTLKLCKGHRKKTAEILDISERSLRDKLKSYTTSSQDEFVSV